ncbi:MAG: SsrA-binding protein SmpB [Holosporales bacterium]|jgi:SsrA-binding protein|nr:SsrA-binding protein SmpB [Holosporales bacterium]
MSKNVTENFKVIAENRKASFNYTILEIFEAGIILQGTEVKSLRQNHCSITESFIGEMGGSGRSRGPTGELFLFNANIPVYSHAKMFNHAPKAPRKILLHKKESNKLLGAIRRKGLTIVPLSMFFNPKGLVKVKIALAQGKNVSDKRETIKERDWNRDKSRILKKQYTSS